MTGGKFFGCWFCLVYLRLVAKDADNPETSMSTGNNNNKSLLSLAKGWEKRNSMMRNF